jgi:putative lipoprotein
MGSLSRLVVALTLVLAMASASGCSSSGQAGPQVSPTAPALAGTSWLAENIGRREVLKTWQTTLSFGSSDRVSGNGGCNRYGGPVEIKGDVIRFGPLAATSMGCEPAVSDQERRFFAALGSASRFSFTPDGKLMLYDSRGAPVLVFSRLET